MKEIEGQFGVSRFWFRDIDLRQDQITVQNKMNFVDLKDLQLLLATVADPRPNHRDRNRKSKRSDRLISKNSITK